MKVIVLGFDFVEVGRFFFCVDVLGVGGELDVGGVLLQQVRYFLNIVFSCLLVFWLLLGIYFLQFEYVVWNVDFVLQSFWDWFIFSVLMWVFFVFLLVYWKQLRWNYYIIVWVIYIWDVGQILFFFNVKYYFIFFVDYQLIEIVLR